MGNTCRKKKKNSMIRNLTRSVVGAGGSILYYTTSDVSEHPMPGENVTCEEVCFEIGQLLNISPTMLYCFSLAVIDTTVDTTGQFRWLSWSDRMGFDLNTQEIHFRMRFVPYKEKCSELRKVDQNCLQYLFHQLNTDFQAGRLSYYDDDKEKESLGVVLISIFVKMRRETELKDDGEGGVLVERVDTFMKNGEYRLKKFLPKSFKTNIFANWRINKTLAQKLLEYQEKYPYDSVKSDSLITSQVHVILKSSHSYYYFERYVAFYLTLSENGTIDHSKEIELVIEMGCKFPTVKLIQKQSSMDVCLLQDISELEIREMTIEGTCWWRVNIVWYGGTPKVLFFKQREEARSFVSCVEVYYRLIINFYYSLCHELRPKICQILVNIRAHGPVTDEFVRRKLQEKQSSSVYILRSSTNKYSEYEILFWNQTDSSMVKRSLGKVVQEDGKYKIEGMDLEAEEDMKTLIQKAILSHNLVPENSMRMKPQTEGCDVLQRILQEREPEVEEEQGKKQKVDSQPRVYMASAVNNQRLLGEGHFTTVYEGHLDDTDQVVVKQLRDLDINDVRMYKELEKSFSEGINRHMQLFDPRYFIGLVGLRMTSPVGLILKQASFGSLTHLLQSEQGLTLKHLIGVVLQLGEVLMYMWEKKLAHGNIHCDNLLVSIYDPSDLVVKLAEPGLVTLYNKLPLKTEVNRKRLPWIAPEKHDDLSLVTIETEVFSIGTTMWQMFAAGESPLAVDPRLKHRSFDQLCAYYKSKDVRLSVPLFLQQQPPDTYKIKEVKENMYECMCTCWTRDIQDRPDPATFLKSINNRVVPYKGYYHEYNIIPTEDEDGSQYPLIRSGFSANTDSMATGDSTIEGYERNEKSVLDDLATLVPSDSQSPVRNGPPSVAPVLSLTTTTPSRTLTVSMTTSPSQAASASMTMAHPMTGVKLPQTPAKTSTISVSNVRFLISESRLQIDRSVQLGKGFYGEIYQGVLTVEHRQVPVAVKVVKSQMVDKFADAFRKEAALMEKLEHTNIVKFYGICRQGEQVVMELVENNSLHAYLVHRRQSRSIQTQTVLNISLDVSKGMEYLSSQNVLHCDLAARNILLTKDLTAKISDFGLSKILQAEDDYYRRPLESKAALPLFWCAPEWIAFRRFTTKCDVWSFGIVLWEIASYGKYPSILGNRDQKEIYRILEKGERLQKPQGCLDELYSLMLACWNLNADLRPDFTDCRCRISDLQETQTREQNNAVSASNCGTSDVTSETVDAATASPIPNPSIITNGNDEHLVGQTKADSKEVPAEGKRDSTTMLTAVDDVRLQSREISLSGSWLLKHCELFREKQLGKGSYGCVFEGRYNGKPVAVKDCTKDPEYARFKREVGVLAKLKHPNIVSFYGLIKKDDEPIHYMYVMELMRGGSLHSHLQACYKRKQVEPCDRKIQYLIDIAKGMCYLAEKCIIHGDLTTSNILLDSDLSAKISDFGFTKEMEEPIYIRGEKTQFKTNWASPEVFQGRYTRPSDIWSFGVVGMEVFLDGRLGNLYDKIERSNYGEITAKIVTGEHYKCPESCPVEVYETFLSCWKIEPCERKPFVEIKTSLSQILEGLRSTAVA